MMVRTQASPLTVAHNITRWDGPQYRTYNTHAARLRSYKNLPCALKQKPAQLSKAGSFYTGKSLQEYNIQVNV
jgi:hypothetical protein